MYIDEIELENIRGFKSLKFSLKRPNSGYAGLTVFAGDNGSGKSTLLKAIAIALTGTEVARALQPSFQNWIQHNEETATITLRIKPDTKDGFIGQGNSHVKLFSTQIKLKANSRDVALESKPNRDVNSLWTSSVGWFSCGYGPFRRVFGASSDATRQMMATTTGRFVTMFYEAASLAEVNSWLRDLSHKALENKANASEQLQLLISLLNHNLLPNEMKVARVDSEGVWLQDKNGIELSWDEMSDGYRSVIALLADIIRHLIEVFGHGSMVTKQDNQFSINSSGVVLIDELDAHLHPEWQITIGNWLKSHFPNIQFLVTTHSPLICQAADENGLFHLPEPGSSDQPRAIKSEEYQKIINSRSDVILRSSLFGLQNTRSAQAISNRKRVAELNAKKRSGAKMTETEAHELIQLRGFLENEDD